MSAYPPIPCSHCGANFMRHDLDPEAPKVCNSCKIREKEREKTIRKPGDKYMSDIQIMIECDKQTQIEVEELCLNRGISYSQYFLELHHISKEAESCLELGCEEEVKQMTNIPSVPKYENGPKKVKGAKK